MDPEQTPESWKVVIHTGGRSGLSRMQSDYLDKVPGKPRRKWRPAIRNDGGVSPLLLDYDMYLHVGPNSPYVLTDAQEIPERMIARI